MPSERTCGECTACCKTHPIFRIEKPMGKWCQHCNIGKGCKIYDERPEECVGFKCQWFMGYGLNSERPDITKIVVDYCELEIIGKKILSLWEVSEGRLHNKLAQDQTKMALTARIPVLHVYLSGKQMLYLPKDQALTREECSKIAENSIEIIQT